jgi:hypothetical protein
MSLRKSPDLSEKMLAANRRNAQKSTGPRTPEGKRRASVHPRWHSHATPESEAFREMAMVGDEPELLGRLERDLTEAWQPANAMQELIVADLAMLYFKKAALERTLRLKRFLEVQQLAVAMQEHMLGRDVDEPPIDDVLLRKFGYRGAEPCQRAFAESQRLLDLLKDRVERRDWAGDLAPIMSALYGENSTVPAENIQRLFSALAAAQGQNGADGIETQVAELERLIAEQERACVAEEKSYLREQESLYNLRLGFQWAPITANWGTALQKDRMLDAAIGAKAKLLMRLKGRYGYRPGRRKAVEE